MSDDVSLGLSHDQALVLFAWLARTGAGERPAAIEDQAEQRVLWAETHVGVSVEPAAVLVGPPTSLTN